MISFISSVFYRSLTGFWRTYALSRRGRKGGQSKGQNMCKAVEARKVRLELELYRRGWRRTDWTFQGTGSQGSRVLCWGVWTPRHVVVRARPNDMAVLAVILVNFFFSCKSYVEFTVEKCRATKRQWKSLVILPLRG